VQGFLSGSRLHGSGRRSGRLTPPGTGTSEAIPAGSARSELGRWLGILLVSLGVVALADASSPPAPRHGIRPAPPFRLVSVGGGSGGTSGGKIWAATWWNGTPRGPVYTGAPSPAICIWHDIGNGLSTLDAALGESSLPRSFWSVPEEGGHPGIWWVNEWAVGVMRDGAPSDHFDLVACPQSEPPNSRPVEDLPRAHPPDRSPLEAWLFWDTVPNPSDGHLPGIIGEAFDRARVPDLSIGTSPDEVDGGVDSTVVNLPTWLWVNPHGWHAVVATADGGGYVATVWASPVTVGWRAWWDFPSPADDPEGGTTFGPEVLDQVCSGPGSVYDPERPGASTDCAYTFTQSTFGTVQALRATISWNVAWALSSTNGVIGGEGSLGTIQTTSSRPLRVLQVESIISAG
jgi:hypothetical protein